MFNLFIFQLKVIGPILGLEISKRQALSKTLCTLEEGVRFNRQECIDRTCDDCGTKNLLSQLQKKVKEKVHILISVYIHK